MACPDLKPWFRPEPMAAMAPGPGDKLMATVARKKGSQVANGMARARAGRGEWLNWRSVVGTRAAMGGCGLARQAALSRKAWAQTG
jgi:hypothetical protein